jgi:hypothetical protein
MAGGETRSSAREGRGHRAHGEEIMARRSSWRLARSSAGRARRGEEGGSCRAHRGREGLVGEGESDAGIVGGWASVEDWRERASDGGGAPRHIGRSR